MSATYATSLLILFIRLALTQGAADDVLWSYDNEAEWPEYCQTGTFQSPINIETKKAIVDYNGLVIQDELYFDNYEHKNVTISNDGHTVNFIRMEDADEQSILRGGPLASKQYVFYGLHLHWEAEHTIDGYRAPLEIHFVHHRSDLTFHEAVGYHNGLVAIGVFCKVIDEIIEEANWPLEQLVQSVETLTARDSTVLQGHIHLKNLLPQEKYAYYTYFGSLTTPNCNEAVRWIVMEDEVPITRAQLNSFMSLDVGTTYNFRSTRPLNGRRVFKTIQSAKTGQNGGTTLMNFSHHISLLSLIVISHYL